MLTTRAGNTLIRMACILAGFVVMPASRGGRALAVFSVSSP
jgi:hypothetical protein